MLLEQRHREIVSIVERSGSVRVTDLAQQFSVTEETIRRDLERLQTLGRLVRSHGGAVRAEKPGREQPYWEREHQSPREKRAIAALAARRIREGDTLYLDASSTVWHLALALPEVPLTVVTHSILLARRLAASELIRVVLPGGELSRASLSLEGPQTVDDLNLYCVDKAFISCAGVTPTAGPTDRNAQQAAIRRRSLERAKEGYLLFDHSKIGFQALTVVAPWTAFKEAITDAQADERFVRDLRRLGVSCSLAS